MRRYKSISSSKQKLHRKENKGDLSTHFLAKYSSKNLISLKRKWNLHGTINGEEPQKTAFDKSLSTIRRSYSQSLEFILPLELQGMISHLSLVIFILYTEMVHITANQLSNITLLWSKWIRVIVIPGPSQQFNLPILDCPVNGVEMGTHAFIVTPQNYVYFIKLSMI